MSKWKTLTAVFLAGTMLALSACAGQDGQPQGGAQESGAGQAGTTSPQGEIDTEERESARFTAEYAYKAEELDVLQAGDLYGMDTLSLSGDRTAGLRAVQNENGFYTGPYALVSVDSQGQDYLNQALQIPETDMLQAWCVDDMGTVYCATASEDPAADPDDYENYSLLYKLYAADPDGDLLWTRELKPSGNSDEEEYTVNSLCAADGRILLCDNAGVTVYNADDGSLDAEITTEDAADGRLFHAAGGKVILAGYAEDGMYLTAINPAKGEAAEPVLFKGGQLYTGIYAGGETDLLMTTPNALYSLNVGEEPVKVIDYFDSDLWISDISGLAETSGEERAFTAIAQTTDGEKHFIRLTPAEPAEEEPTLVTLGGCQIDDEIRQQVYLFNLENEGVRISVEEYTELYPDNSAEALREAVFSGQGPDILYLSSDTDTAPYMRGDVLTDLQPMIDGDQAISKVEFLDNVLDLYRRGDELYAITPRFDLTVMAASAAQFDAADKVTLDALNDKLKGAGVTPSVALGGMTRDAFILYAFEMTGRKYIDSQAGTCSLDQDGFRDLLTFAGTIAADEEELDNSMLYREGKAFLYPDTISEFDEYGYLKQTLFGEDITLAGFPLDGTTTAVISGQIPMGIDRRSAVKEEAWGFIRRFLNEEYQASLFSGWPVSRKALEAEAEEARSPFYMEDENGNMTESDYYDQLGDMEIKRTPLTQEETDAFLTWLEGLSQYRYYDDEILRIIFAETDRLYAGEISAEDCTAEIQKQVTEYLKAD